jgi:F-type H+-transporting ATPase subunit alpha
VKPPDVDDRARIRGEVLAALESVEDALARRPGELVLRRVGHVASVGHGIARVRGLRSVRADELLHFPGGLSGIATDVLEREVGVVLLGAEAGLRMGSEVRRTGRVLSVPVGEALLGRVLDPLGRPLDGEREPHTTEQYPVEREAPAILDRDPVRVPLETGLKVVDALLPIGRGQRELILGDRQTGKTAIALDTILNQAGRGVLCVYCAIGQRSSGVAKLIEALRRRGALAYTIVVVADPEDPPGVRFVAPYAATSMAEWFTRAGRDVLIVYDDLTQHAQAYRELSLLLRRPPGREAYPGDIFYVHSRLLERATHLSQGLGGGSLTALPIAQTEAQNLAAYIPTNLISITDGQIYLSPDLFQKGQLPAVEVGRSVSRVGGKAQEPVFRKLAGPLRLAYAQFEELEAFARFGTKLDPETRARLERGRRVRRILEQPDLDPIPSHEQIAAFVAVTEGAFDELPEALVGRAERELRERLASELPGFPDRVRTGGLLDAESRAALVALAGKIAARLIAAKHKEQAVGEPRDASQAAR